MAQQQNPVNEATEKPVKKHSRFTPNFSFFHTEKYGILNPKYPMETVEGDHIMLRNQDDVDTYTLKAPLMTPVRKVSFYTSTPLRAILPINAERIITNPLQGDDVDAEKVNCGLPYKTLLSKIQALVGAIPFPNNASGYTIDSTKALALLNWLVSGGTYLQNLISAGSLLANLGVNLSRLGEIGVISPDPTHEGAFKTTIWSFDRFFDWVCSIITGNAGYLTIKVHKLGDAQTVVSSGNLYVACQSSPYIAEEKRKTISFRRFIEMLNEGKVITVESVNNWNEVSVEYSMFSNIHLRKTGSPATADDFDQYINLSRLVAYQLTQAEFFTNDKVDDVYSARLYHDNMLSLLHLAISQYDRFVYICNGVSVQYDSVSGALIDRVLTYLPGEAPQNSVAALARHAYFFNLFGLQRSLRYGDYFAGAKVNPLAIGDVNVGVDSDSMTVDVIDITRNIQRQRFLNQVNRVGRKFKDYVKGIFGVEPMPDAHEVFYVGSTTDTIGAEETSNTGADQRAENNRTSNLRSNASRFAFEVTTNEPCYIICVQYFDMPRAYKYGIDRLAMHSDRFEMFNPFMQNIGDQDVAGIELDPMQASEFGYQLRYAEYKQRVDRAAGGFADYLPGYAVLADFPGLSDNDNESIEINSDFIRCRPSEFDDLYTSMTHYSLAGYFHFIVRSDFEVTADRPMAFAPSIL